MINIRDMERDELYVAPWLRVDEFYVEAATLTRLKIPRRTLKLIGKMKRCMLWVLIAILGVACTKTDDAIDALSKDRVIYASLEEDGTRVQLNNKKQTVWTKGDIIKVHGTNASGDPFMELWKYNGETGQRNAEFYHYATYSNVSTKYKYDKFYAMYNHTGYYGGYSDGTPVYYTTLYSTQEYLPNSYGLSANTTFGESEDGKNFKFKNLFGYLRLSLTGSKVVESIELTGNNSETIAGLYVFVSKNLQFVQWSEDSSNPLSNTIIIDCGSGVQLSNKVTDFYIVLPPMTFNKGISVTVNFTDGTIYPKTTSKPVVIERNTIQPMKAFNTGGEVEWQSVVIYHTGSVVSAPILHGASSLTGEIYWGDGYMSPFGEYDEYTYTDGNSSHVIETKSLGAQSIELQSCAGITEIDLSNFK